MKKLLKMLGAFLLTILVLVLLLAVYIQWYDGPNYDEEVVELKVDATPERLIIGEKIVSNLCVSCHRAEDGTLSGRVLIDHEKWGLIVAANITKHPESKISAYSDGELFRLFKRGITREGRMPLPMMPRFGKISDEDLFSLIAFLRSDHAMLKPVKNDLPESRSSFFLKSLMKFAIKPTTYSAQVIETPASENVVEYGRYLVNGRYSCFECHSRSSAKINYEDPALSEGYLGGGSNLMVFGNTFGIRSANISPHDQMGIGAWTVDDFRKAVTVGYRPDGKLLRAPMNRMKLDSLEVEAIYAYLKTVPPVANDWPYDARLSESK